MKFLLLIIIPFFGTNLIKNANSVDERGEGPKLYKTFDEIFGKGWDDESNCRHVKKEVQDVQAPKTSDQKNIEEILKQKFDDIYDENWSEDEDNSAPTDDDLDQDNSKKHLSDQNNLTDQNESVDEQQNEPNKCEKIESDQKKREIIQKFREIKDNYCEKNKHAHSAKEWNQIEIKISNGLGLSRTTIYKWMKELGLNKKFSDFKKREIIKKFREMKKDYKKNKKYENNDRVQFEIKISSGLGLSRTTIYKWIQVLGLSQNKSKFSDFKKLEILKQFDEIKSKCKKAKLKNISMNELDEKIAKKLFVSTATIIRWKRKFGLSVRNKISDATKIGILKKYAKIKGENPKMSDSDIAKMLKISTGSLSTWKKQFQEEKNIRTL